MKLILKNVENHELHNEIITMTCKKYNTGIIYSTEKNSLLVALKKSIRKNVTGMLPVKESMDTLSFRNYYPI